MVYEVVKEVGITESLANAPAMRSLQVGEVLEAETEPKPAECFGGP